MLDKDWKARNKKQPSEDPESQVPDFDFDSVGNGEIPQNHVTIFLSTYTNVKTSTPHFLEGCKGKKTLQFPSALYSITVWTNLMKQSGIISSVGVGSYVHDWGCEK